MRRAGAIIGQAGIGWLRVGWLRVGRTVVGRAIIKQAGIGHGRCKPFSEWCLSLRGYHGDECA